MIQKIKLCNIAFFLLFLRMIHVGVSASVRVKHDVTRTTHRLCVHDRGNRIQRWSNIARRVTSINTQSPPGQAQLRKDRCNNWGLNQWTINVCGVPVPLHQRLVKHMSCELYQNKTFRVSRKNYLAYVRKATLDLDDLGVRENWLAVERTSIVRRSFFHRASLKYCNLLL